MSTQIFISSNEYTTVVVPVSSAQILAMGSSPITLLSAPGTGKYYIVNRVTLEYKFNTIAYTFPSSPTFYLDGCFDSYIDRTLITSSADSVATISGNLRNTYSIGSGSGNTFVRTNRDVLNASLIMGTQNNDNPTGGNGTMNIIIEYKIVTFS